MGKHYPTEFKEQVVNDYKSGMYGGRNQVAKHYNISVKALNHWIDKDHIQGNQLNDIEHKKLFRDSKTILQERINSVKNALLSYKIINESGPDHNKCYEAVALLNEQVIGKGSGHTKKAAEQKAAYQALKTLDKRN